MNVGAEGADTLKLTDAEGSTTFKFINSVPKTPKRWNLYKMQRRNRRDAEGYTKLVAEVAAALLKLRHSSIPKAPKRWKFIRRRRRRNVDFLTKFGSEGAETVTFT